MALPLFDAIVLTGGAGSRLGGAAKAEIVVAGATLLDRARTAVTRARTTVVVGPDTPGGPVAAVATGLARLRSDAHGAGGSMVVVLACDMPLVTATTVTRLLSTLAGTADADAVLLTDDAGRSQYLAAAYRAGPLRDAVRALGAPEGASMRRVVQGLRVHELPTQAEEAMDCDTWAQVRRAGELLVRAGR